MMPPSMVRIAALYPRELKAWLRVEAKRVSRVRGLSVNVSDLLREIAVAYQRNVLNERGPARDIHIHRCRKTESGWLCLVCGEHMAILNGVNQDALDAHTTPEETTQNERPS